MGAQKSRLNEHSKHIFKLMGKKIIIILHSNTLLNWTGWTYANNNIHSFRFYFFIIKMEVFFIGKLLVALRHTLLK